MLTAQLVAYCKRDCPCIVTVLSWVRISTQAVPQCQQEGSQEMVLTALVGTVVLRIICVWECCKDPTQVTKTSYHESMQKCASCVLGLVLDTHWSSHPSLRLCQLENIVALTENNAWQKLVSTCPSEAVATATDVMTTILALIGRAETPSEATCKVFGVVSQILRTSGFARLEPCTGNPINRLISFSRRAKMHTNTLRHGGLECSTMVLDACEFVMARLDDSSDAVRQCALRTLGDFLPFVKPDGAGSQRSRFVLEKDAADEKSFATSVSAATATATNRRGWTTMQYGVSGLS